MAPEVSLLDVRGVCARLSISRPSLYRLLKAGRFPAPFYPGGVKSPRWRSDLVTDWIRRESAATAA